VRSQKRVLRERGKLFSRFPEKSEEGLSAESARARRFLKTAFPFIEATRRSGRRSFTRCSQTVIGGRAKSNEAAVVAQTPPKTKRSPGNPKIQKSGEKDLFFPGPGFPAISGHFQCISFCAGKCRKIT